MFVALVLRDFRKSFKNLLTLVINTCMYKLTRSCSICESYCQHVNHCKRILFLYNIQFNIKQLSDEREYTYKCYRKINRILMLPVLMFTIYIQQTEITFIYTLTNTLENESKNK